MGYKDRTWCPMHINLRCARREGCYRVFTPEDQKAAEAWWGGPDFPVSHFSNIPDCFVLLTMHNPQEKSDGSK